MKYIMENFYFDCLDENYTYRIVKTTTLNENFNIDKFKLDYFIYTNQKENDNESFFNLVLEYKKLYFDYKIVGADLTNISEKLDLLKNIDENINLFIMEKDLYEIFKSEEGNTKHQIITSKEKNNIFEFISINRLLNLQSFSHITIIKSWESRGYKFR